MDLSEKNANAAKGALTYPAESANPQDKRLKLAVNFAYTLNHALVCTATDPLTDVPIGVIIPRLLSRIRHEQSQEDSSLWKAILEGFKPRNVWHEVKATFSLQKRQRQKDGVPQYNPDGSPKLERFTPLVYWFAGEFAGDFGAVPVVVSLEHFAPGFMAFVNKILSPISNPVSRKAAEKAARREFLIQGKEVNSPEFAIRSQEIQLIEQAGWARAAMWSVASTAINVTMQKLMGNEDKVSDLLVAKVVGTTVTSSLTLALRSAAPEKVQKWDEWVSKKAAKPVINTVAKTFGVDKKTLTQGVEAKHRQQKDWSSRVGKSGEEALARG